MNEHKSLINDLVRINVLEDEIEYYKSLLQPHDTGHIQTTISVLSQRLSNLKGEVTEWPFA